MADARDAVVDAATKPLASGAGTALLAARYGPELIRGAMRLFLNPRRIRRRLDGHSETVTVLAASLTDVTDEELGVDEPGLLRALRLWANGDGNKAEHSVQYGPEKGQVLDVWRSKDLDPSAPAPVLVYVPGGGWVTGTTTLQGHVLLGMLAEMGWVCVSTGYRTAPAHRWPTHIHDVKRALAWVHKNIADHGGDPARVAIAGASAGGHMASICAFTQNNPAYQPGFEDDPTDVIAAIGIYGRYCWESRHTPEREGFMTFLEKVIVHARQEDQPELFAAASPIGLANASAPPFFAIHGRSDAVIPIREAREFVEKLRSVSRNPVAFAQLPGTGHGFDIVDPFRASHMARAIALFLRAMDPAPEATAENRSTV